MPKTWINYRVQTHRHTHTADRLHYPDQKLSVEMRRATSRSVQVLYSGDYSEKQSVDLTFNARQH